MNKPVPSHQDPAEDADVMEIVDETGDDAILTDGEDALVIEPVSEEDSDSIVHEEKELAKEIDKVIVPEPTKGGHTLPKHLIDAPLTPNDLYDEGKI